jgi:IMP cyclohydrolase
MKLLDIATELKTNTYPGRGIIIGRSGDGRRAVLIYFIMGRSAGSRNRIFTETEDGIMTESFDPSQLADPSLFVYHPVRLYDGHIIVTNGDQTDTIRDNMLAENSFHTSLLKREFEPDAPNYTPRISGLVLPDGSYKLSIIKSHDGDPTCCCRYFFEYDKPIAGTGHFIHTYKSDGSPIPSFEGEPVHVKLPEMDMDTFAHKLWGSLNPNNKVSLFVRFIRITDGKTDTCIINKNNK